MADILVSKYLPSDELAKAFNISFVRRQSLNDKTDDEDDTDDVDRRADVPPKRLERAAGDQALHLPTRRP